MDEAQRELEKNALQGGDHRDEEEEEDDDDQKAYKESDRRSVRSEDRDLLEGVDAEAMSIKGAEGVTEISTENGPSVTDRKLSGAGSGKVGRPSTETQKFVEFER